MRKHFIFAIGLLASVLAGPAAAQQQVLPADAFLLKTTGCRIKSGTFVGGPNGNVTGSPCDTYIDSNTDKTWWKLSGTNTDTGWISWVSTNTPNYLMSRDASGDSALRHLLAAKVYGNGGTGANELRLGGTGGTCVSYPNCEAAVITLDSVLLQQRLATDLSKGSQWYVTDIGARLNSYNGSGWAPLLLAGGPTVMHAGGVRIGTSTLTDPGLGNATLDGYIGNPLYASQTTGWRIDGLGAADFRYIYADELHARKFIADLEQALAGLQIIAKSVGQVGAVFTVPAPGSISTLTMRDLPSASNMAIFESGDYIWIRQFSRAGGGLSITNAYGVVTGYTDLADGLQSWTFTRLVTNGGSMSTGAEIEVDSIVLDLGVPGNGWVETNAVDGIYGSNAPYTQVVTWSGNSPISGNQTIRARLGNLRGITGVTGEYGLIAGTYAASGGRYIRASNEAFELHGVDMKLWNGATNVIRLDHQTPYMSMGNPAPTSYGSGVGCWSGMDAGAFKWRCGDPSGHNISWNGSTLNVVGNIIVEGLIADDVANVDGVPASQVASGASRANLGLTSAGNPALPAAAGPSGSGLFLGSDKLGYYASGAWKTYMDNAGNFYLGGVGGALQWDAAAGTLSITATLAGNGSGITSINGGNISTGTVTATQIAAGTITGTQIAGGTITGTNIAGGTITGTNIAGGTITGTNIAGGTITGTNIQAGSISATEINVASLSAISANLGTVTAGNITGVNITGSSGTFGPGGSFGEVTLNNLGVTFTAGTNYGNKVNWNDGSAIGSSGGFISLVSSNGTSLLAGSSLTLAATDIWLRTNVGTSSSAVYPVVMESVGPGDVAKLNLKTNGAHGTFCGGGDVVETLTLERGIVTGITCVAAARFQGMSVKTIGAVR